MLRTACQSPTVYTRMFIGSSVAQYPSGQRCSNMSRQRSRTTIEHVESKRVSVCDQRMVKVVGGIVSHADFLHHTTGGNVRRNGKRDNLVKTEDLEPKRQRDSRAFCRIS